MKYDLLMSIKPYYAYLIMKGIKKAEIRKSCHKGKDWSGKIKVYVSKDKKSFKRIPEADRAEFEKYLGTVACEFVVNGITEFTTDYRQADIDELDTILENACLSFEEAVDYDNGKCLYALNVTELKIYDKPKELCDYKTVRFVRGYHKKNETMIERLQNSKRVEVTYVSKAPQSYMRIEEV